MTEKKWKKINVFRPLHQAHLTKMKHSSIVIDCDYKQLLDLSFLNFHISILKSIFLITIDPDVS